MNSKEVIRRIEAAGWRLVRSKGSHHHYRHPDRKEILTIKHPASDYPLGTLKSMERVSGLKLR